MNLRHAALVLSLALAATGCSALDRVNDALYETGAFDLEPTYARAVARDCGVLVVAGARHGRGAIVGPRTVLTVAHVVGDEREVEVATSSLVWTKARVVRRIAASPEAIVELELTVESGLLGFGGFEEERRAASGTGEPAWVVTARGLEATAGRGLRTGDSGSPVIDARGALVALLVGTAGGRAVSARIPTLETLDGGAVLARR